MRKPFEVGPPRVPFSVGDAVAYLRAGQGRSERTKDVFNWWVNYQLVVSNSDVGGAGATFVPHEVLSS